MKFTVNLYDRKDLSIRETASTLVNLAQIIDDTIDVSGHHPDPPPFGFIRDKDKNVIGEWRFDR